MRFPFSAFRRVSVIVLALTLVTIAAMAPAAAPAGTGNVAAEPLHARLASQSLAACRCQQRAERAGAPEASSCWRDFWSTARPLDLSNLRPPHAATLASPAAICVEGKGGPWCLTLRWQTAYGVLCTADEARSLDAAMQRAPVGDPSDIERRAVRDIRDSVPEVGAQTSAPPLSLRRARA